MHQYNGFFFIADSVYHILHNRGCFQHSRYRILRAYIPVEMHDSFFSKKMQHVLNTDL